MATPPAPRPDPPADVRMGVASSSMARRVAFVVAWLGVVLLIGWRREAWLARRHPGPRMGKVVVAAEDLPAGTRLRVFHVRVVERPMPEVPRDSVWDPDRVLGRTVTLSVAENEPVLLFDLAPEQSWNGHR